MAIALAAHVAQATSTGTTFTTTAHDMTGSPTPTLLTAVIGYSLSGGTLPPGLTDSSSNTWVALTATSADVGCVIYYAKNATVSSSQTFTITSSNGHASICVASWSGVDTVSPFDQQNVNQNVMVTSIQAGSITPGSNNELILAGFANAQVAISSLAIDSGFTLLDSLSFLSGTHEGAALAYLIQTTATAENPTWSWTTQVQAGAAIASFKASAAAQPFSYTPTDVPPGPIFPSQLRTFLNDTDVYLIGQDQLFGAAGQTKTYDWPNPRGPQPNNTQFTFTGNLNLELFGKDQQFAGPAQWKGYDYPNPLIPRQPVSNLTWTISLQETTLSPSAQAPFALYDWPNPKGPQFPSGLKEFTVGLQQTTLTPATVNPFNQNDFPNPKAPQFPIADVGFINYFALDSNVPFLGYADQGNPRGPVFPIDLRTWAVNLLPNTLFGVSTPPVIQTDWPNPQIPRQPSDNKTFLNDVDLQLIGQDKFFGAPGQGQDFDYPNPTGPKYPTALLTWTVSLNQTTLLPTAVNPFALYDWPNPRGPIAAIDLRTFTNSMELQLLNKDQFFGVAGEGPTYDWPNPRGPQYPSDLRTFLNAVELQLIGKDQFFGELAQLQKDFPNPQLPRPVSTLHTGSVGFNSNLPPPVIVAPKASDETEIGMDGTHGGSVGGFKTDLGG